MMSETRVPRRHLRLAKAAVYAGFSKSKLDKLRVFGGGPVFIKAGRVFLYDILAFARYQAPLPPPQMFRDYEEVLPGAADRIISMAEKEQSHRHRWEADALRADRWYRMAGLSAGWTVALGLAAAAAASGVWGDWRVGCALAATSATTMVWKLIQGRSKDGDEPPAEQSR